MADNIILSKLDGLQARFEEISQKITDPEVLADMKQFVQLNKEYKEIQPIIAACENYKTIYNNIA